MRDALARVKEALGAHAVILGTRTITPSGLKGLVRQARVEITAAPADAALQPPRLRGDAGPSAAPRRIRAEPAAPQELAPPTSVPRSAATPAWRPPAITPAPAAPSMPAALRRHYERLVAADVAEALAERLTREIAGRLGPRIAHEHEVQAELARRIAELAPSVGGIPPAAGKTQRIALVGPPGAGKTTTLAKLAAHFALREKRRVALLSLDAHRPGTHDQLRRYAELIRIPLYAAQTVAGVRKLVRDGGDHELLLIDTHGIGLREDARLPRLSALLRAARPDQVHLVLPASYAPGVQERAAAAFAALGTTHLVVTRIDEALGFGVVLQAAERARLTLSYLCDGQRVPRDIAQASSAGLAASILGP